MFARALRALPSFPLKRREGPKASGFPKGDSMINIRDLVLSCSLVALSAIMVQAQDLSSYRGFQFGMNLVSVARQIQMKPSDAKTLHRRPNLIQELWWQRPLSDPSPRTDPVREVIFCFNNGELFRMVVRYDRQRTEGLTEGEMIEDVSANYGGATMPAATRIRFSSSRVYNESEKILARWEDAQYSFNLFRYSYDLTFGMVLLSKQRDALAQTAVADAIQLDKRKVPQREIKREKE